MLRQENDYAGCASMTQSEYDRLLVESFYLRPDYKMRRLCGGDDISGLIRVPVHVWHFNMSVSVFVCNYIPKLSESLFKRTINDVDLIVKVLQKSKLDILKRGAHEKSVSIDVSEIKKEIARYNKMNALFADIADGNIVANGTDWHTVKGFAVRQRRIK